MRLFLTALHGLKAYPTSDVNGRNTGKEITDENGNKKYGEYIYYRKVGDHATNMPSAVWYAHGTEIKDNVKYKYDSCGNIIEITENGALSAKYEYDSLNRLIREDNRKFNKTWLYSYDSCGNIQFKRETVYTRKTEDEIADFTEEKQYGYEGDRLTSYGGIAIVYDTYGNPTSYKGNALTWQYGKRLTKYGTTAFTYDGYGRRLTKGSTVFTYDANGNLVKQSDGTNTLEFVYDGNGLNGFNCNGTNYLYRKNAQGDITHILDTSGMVVAKYVYDAWGNHAVLDSNGNDVQSGIGLLNPFRYRSYYYDSETDLYFLQTRYYDPEVGRFLSQDDVSYLDPEHINGLNLYAYCLNNPVMGCDPTGTWDWNIFWNIVVGSLAVVVVTGLVVATAGLAAVAVVGAGSSIVSSVMFGAAVGGLLSGGLELAGQLISSGGQSIDLNALAIESFTGAVFGALTGGYHSVSSNAAKIGFRALRRRNARKIRQTRRGLFTISRNGSLRNKGRSVLFGSVGRCQPLHLHGASRWKHYARLDER